VADTERDAGEVRPDPGAMAEAASLAGAIERWAGDLALGEEPSNFAVALEAGAPRD